MTPDLNKRLSTATAVVPVAAALTFAGNAGNAGTVITDFDRLTADNSSQSFDLDGDGSLDFIFTARDDFGFIQGAGTKVKTIDAASFDPFVFTTQLAIDPTQADASIANFAVELFSGDEVGPDYVGTRRAAGLLYIDGPETSFGALGGGVGDTAFIGLGLRSAEGTNFGWAEFERGSAILLRTGFQTTTGAAAAIPAVAPVPLPGALVMLATGAAGLGAFRRRKKAA